MKSLALSLLSGFLAALAATCGKLAMASDESCWLCERLTNQFKFCESISVYLRIVFFLLMIVSNGIMWTVFVKALNHSSTTVEATVTNTAANFFFTAIFGQVFFGEMLSILWWLGTLMILFGLFLMHQGSKMEISNENKSAMHKKKLR